MPVKRFDKTPMPVREAEARAHDFVEVNSGYSSLRAAFVWGDARVVRVPGSGRKVAYDPLQRIGVGLSRLGTSRATALGAYAFALSALDRR